MSYENPTENRNIRDIAILKREPWPQRFACYKNQLCGFVAFILAVLWRIHVFFIGKVRFKPVQKTLWKQRKNSEKMFLFVMKHWIDWYSLIIDYINHCLLMRCIVSCLLLHTVMNVGASWKWSKTTLSLEIQFQARLWAQNINLRNIPIFKWKSCSLDIHPHRSVFSNSTNNAEIEILKNPSYAQSLH